MTDLATAAPPSAETSDALQMIDVRHSFGRTSVLNGISLDVRQGEFLTLLGPSGCGKTTMLRIVAGFVRPDCGLVSLDGQDLVRVPAHKRPVHYVFQRPTLFPHLNVAENVAFGLRLARLSRDEVQGRVTQALDMVQLPGLEKRRADQLSGGQMQRVALARALVLRPRVLLLDEPLSALDQKIKMEMEGELRRLHREIGATFIHVTHDQREALAIADRVVVMEAGTIAQDGSPDDIYRRPASEFTARFVGNANVLPLRSVNASPDDPQALDVVIGTHSTRIRVTSGRRPDNPSLVVRAEAVKLAESPADGILRGVISDTAFRGSAVTYWISVDGLPEPIRVEAPTTNRDPGLPIGVSVGVTWDPSAGSLVPTADTASG